MRHHNQNRLMDYIGRAHLMNSGTFVDRATVMARDQVTLPPDVKKALGITPGDTIAFVVKDKSVEIVNPAIYAMEELQKRVAGHAEKAGWSSEDDVYEYIHEMRKRDGL